MAERDVVGFIVFRFQTGSLHLRTVVLFDVNHPFRARLGIWRLGLGFCRARCRLCGCPDRSWRWCRFGGFFFGGRGRARWRRFGAATSEPQHEQAESLSRFPSVTHLETQITRGFPGCKGRPQPLRNKEIPKATEKASAASTVCDAPTGKERKKAKR